MGNARFLTTAFEIQNLMGTISEIHITAGRCPFSPSKQSLSPITMINMLPRLGKFGDCGGFSFFQKLGGFVDLVWIIVERTNLSVAEELQLNCTLVPPSQQITKLQLN